MRLPVDLKVHSLTGGVFTILIAAGLGGCATVDGSGDTEIAGTTSMASLSGTAVNGPQSDYPLVVGDPYQVGGITFTPVDTMNYDEVGYVSSDAGAMGYSAAHHTLPYPSYVEVTSLETGKTILARVERRGPMVNGRIAALSPGALTALGASDSTPVRIRRVNALEEDRALLRQGVAASSRMDTPMSLVEVLKRKLVAPASVPVRPAPPQQVVVAPSTAAPAPAPAAAENTAPALAPLAVPQPSEPAEAAPPAAAPASESAALFVQAASFSTDDRAARAATVLGGTVERSGRYFRVRTGPFANRGEAEASLAKVRAAGYSDARIVTTD